MVPPSSLPHRNHQYRLRARQYVWNYLEVHPCVHCGEDDPIVLEFDHLDPTTKTANISKLVGNGAQPAKIQSEIDKCRVLCCNCHRRHTVEQMGHYRSLHDKTH